LNWPRVGLIVFFMPAVWQVYTVKPTLFLESLWDACAYFSRCQFLGLKSLREPHYPKYGDALGAGQSTMPVGHDPPFQPLTCWGLDRILLGVA